MLPASTREQTRFFVIFGPVKAVGSRNGQNIAVRLGTKDWRRLPPLVHVRLATNMTLLHRPVRWTVCNFVSVLLSAIL